MKKKEKRATNLEPAGEHKKAIAALDWTGESFQQGGM
jgi:hypothetical protein